MATQVPNFLPPIYPLGPPFPIIAMAPAPPAQPLTTLAPAPAPEASASPDLDFAELSKTLTSSTLKVVPPAVKQGFQNQLVRTAARELVVMLQTLREKVFRGEPLTREDIGHWLAMSSAANGEKNESGLPDLKASSLSNATRLLLLSSLSDTFSTITANDYLATRTLEVSGPAPPPPQPSLAWPIPSSFPLPPGSLIPVPPQPIPPQGVMYPTSQTQPPFRRSHHQKSTTKRASSTPLVLVSNTKSRLAPLEAYLKSQTPPLPSISQKNATSQQIPFSTARKDRTSKTTKLPIIETRVPQPPTRPPRSRARGGLDLSNAIHALEKMESNCRDELIGEELEQRFILAQHWLILQRTANENSLAKRRPSEVMLSEVAKLLEEIDLGEQEVRAMLVAVEASNFALISKVYSTIHRLCLLQIAESKHRAQLQADSLAKLRSLRSEWLNIHLPQFFSLQTSRRAAITASEAKLREEIWQNELRTRLHLHASMLAQLAQGNNEDAARSIQRSWRSSDSRRREKERALHRKKEKTRQEWERNRALARERVEEEEMIERRRIEKDQAAQWNEWKLAYETRWNRLLQQWRAEQDRQMRLAHEETWRQLDESERQAVVSEHARLRASLLALEQQTRDQLLRQWRSIVQLSQLNNDQHRNFFTAESRHRNEIERHQAERWYTLTAELQRVVGAMQLRSEMELLLLTKEAAARAKLLENEAEFRKHLYDLRWVDLRATLRNPHKMALRIQCAWRSFLARRFVGWVRAHRHWTAAYRTALLELLRSEREGRDVIEAAETKEFEFLLELEEEQWTRIHVRRIEKAYAAYKTRRDLNRRIAAKNGQKGLPAEFYPMPANQQSQQYPLMPYQMFHPAYAEYYRQYYEMMFMQMDPNLQAYFLHSPFPSQAGAAAYPGVAPSKFQQF